MANTWFRLYSEFRSDPKVRTLPEPYQLRLIWLFCLRCDGPTRGLKDEEVAFALGVTPLELIPIREAFLDKGFIDEKWDVLQWGKRQFLSDSSTQRVREHRARKELKQDETLHETNMKRRETVSVTAPEQNRTEQRHNKNLSHASLGDEESLFNFSEKTLFSLWNQHCGNLPKVEAFTEKRKRKAQARIRSGLTEERFLRAVRCCTEKPFLRGENSSAWTATCDWLIANDENIEKAINNPYGAGGANGNGRTHSISGQREQNTRDAAQRALEILDGGGVIPA